MFRTLIVGLAIMAFAAPVHAQVPLFKGVIGKVIEQTLEKATEPDRPVNCGPIRGRPQNDERCRMA